MFAMEASEMKSWDKVWRPVKSIAPGSTGLSPLNSKDKLALPAYSGMEIKPKGEPTKSRVTDSTSYMLVSAGKAMVCNKVDCKLMPVPEGPPTVSRDEKSTNVRFSHAMIVTPPPTLRSNGVLTLVRPDAKYKVNSLPMDTRAGKEMEVMALV